jgi:hypothetical protein
MHRKVLVKDVNFPTDCIGSRRNISCRGTGFKITMNGKSRVVPDRLEGMSKLNEWRMEG